MPATPTSTAPTADPFTPTSLPPSVSGLPEGPPPDVVQQAAIGPAGDSATAAAAYGVWESMQSTRYQHHYFSDIPSGIYRFDCVGWTTFLLAHAAPQAEASLRQGTGVTNRHYVPTPRRYTDFLRSLSAVPRPGWAAVSRVADLAPGDLITWTGGSDDPGTVGHALVVAGPPTRQADGTYAVVVIDSTAGLHGPDDTRRSDPRDEPLAGTSKPSGLGIGTIGLVADPSTGAPVAERWSLGTKAVPKVIGLGRPTS